MPASSGTHIQPPTSTNLKQYNAAQPDTSCTTTIDMPASQPCSSTYTYLHYNNAASTSKSSYYTESSQNSNCHLHHTIHSEYSTLHPAICPHTCIQNIFLSQHHQHMEQPGITNSTTIQQLRQTLQSTPTFGRRGAPCSAGSEWTSHA